MALIELERRDSVAILTIDSPPVNALTQALRAGLLDALAEAESDPGLVAIVIRCAGRTFIAGADIREFDQGLRPPHTPEVVARIEALDKPVVAAIHGSALGGGLEIALGCHGRIAATEAMLGFPEVRLGLIPGASGTQRLPRLVGAEAALDLMLSGQPINAQRAKRLGIVDAVAPMACLLDAAIERGRALADQATPLPRIREHAVTPVEPGFFEAYRDKIAERTRGQLAPECIVRSVENASTLAFDEAVRLERALFLRCLESEQSQALRYAFFAERAVARPSDAAKGVAATPLSTVAVVGAGTMGIGIAYSFLSAGFSVLLHDLDRERVDAARARILELADAAVTKARMSIDVRHGLASRLSTTVDLEDADSVDLVVEAVPENLELKQAVFAKLDAICRDGALLATNTSTLDIDRIAAATHRSDDVLGLHFFSPANVMRLIEIVRGARSSERAVASAVDLARRLGKLGVVVGNGYGFVGNRLFHSYGREAQLLLLEGAAPEQIDQALYDWGMAMGPHAVGDLAGLDVGYKIRRERGETPNDPMYFRVADLLAEAGRYGQKTGLGMYRYAPGSRVPLPDPAVAALIAREAERLGLARRQIEDGEIVDRCIYALIVEGARALEEGLARCAADIDVIWLNGYGFPRYRGGPMYHADRIGLAEVVATINDFGRRLGTRYWRVPRLLEELAQRGQRFADFGQAEDARG